MTFGGQGRLSPPQPTVALRRSASPARSPSSHGRSPTDESQQVDAFDDGAEDSDEDLFGEGRGEDAGPRSAAAGTAATANSEAAATSAGVGDGDEAVELERPYAECTLTVSIGKTTIGKDSAIGLWTHHKAPDLEKLGVKRMRELLIEKAEGVVSAADKGRISSDEPPVVYYYDRAKGGRNGGNPTNVSTPNILQTPTQLQALLKAARPSKRKRARLVLLLLRLQLPQMRMRVVTASWCARRSSTPSTSTRSRMCRSRWTLSARRCSRPRP
jgi:hypothetical protein